MAKESKAKRARAAKVGKKRAHRGGRRGHGGTHVVPAHMLGKSLTKHVGRKRSHR